MFVKVVNKVEDAQGFGVSQIRISMQDVLAYYTFRRALFK